MRRFDSISAICLAILLFAPSVTAQSESDRPEGVDDFMTYHLGRWESKTSYFDRDGNVVRTSAEGYGEKVLVDGQVNLHFHYAADGTVNTAFRFFNTKDDRVYMVDVTSKGDFWVLSGERGAGTLHSMEKELNGGRKMTLRFTHAYLGPEAFEAIVEISFDQGETWTKYSKQSYRKVGEGFER